jgi:hypothetical protein
MGRAAAMDEGSGSCHVLNKIFHYLDQVTRTVGRFDTEHWVIVGAILIVVGLICMRGFGSQKAY